MEPRLATKCYRDPHNHNRHLRLIVEGGLHYIRGNHAPYFSLTCTEQVRGIGNKWHDKGGGANHELILKHYPRFADLAALNLSDIDGVPMHAEANGWYWLAGALGGLGEQYHGGGSTPPRSEVECLRIFSKHCRISQAEAAQLCLQAMKGTHRTIRTSIRTIARSRWAAICENMKPRWKHEAESCIREHNLRVYGDQWEAKAA